MVQQSIHCDFKMNKESQIPFTCQRDIFSVRAEYRLYIIGNANVAELKILSYIGYTY